LGVYGGKVLRCIFEYHGYEANKGLEKVNIEEIKNTYFTSYLILLECLDLGK